MKRKTTRREDYLKLIHTISKTKGVRGVDLARELEVSRPTVSIFLKQLVEAGDVTMDEHRIVHLTEQGRRVAEAIGDKHCILYELLRSLGVPEAIAAEDACAMEHNISPESLEALKLLVQERKKERKQD